VAESYEDWYERYKENPYLDRSADLGWLDMTKPDGTPLDDEQIPILDEPPFVTEVRMMPGGPYYIFPDSAIQMPTDFLAGINTADLYDAVDFANSRPEGVTEEGEAPSEEEEHRALLRDGGPAAKKLLGLLERGTAPDFETAVRERMEEVGLL
jgi:hypothetical protein